MNHHCGWKEAQADVPHEGEDIPVLRGGLREGRGHKLSAPEHTDMWFWGLNVHHERWPLPQKLVRELLQLRAGGCVRPVF